MDLLTATDAELTYAVRRACGSEAARWRSANKIARSAAAADSRRVVDWLDWLDQEGEPLAVSAAEGDRLVWVVRVADSVAWRLLDRAPTFSDRSRPIGIEERRALDEATDRAAAARHVIRSELALDGARGVLIDPVLDPEFDPDYDPVPGPEVPSTVAPALDPLLGSKTPEKVGV